MIDASLRMNIVNLFLAQEICGPSRPQPRRQDDGRDVYCHFV
jgi:hypothetical protein